MTSKSKQLKRLWSLALLLVLMCLPQMMWAGGIQPTGHGTDEDPFLITNEAKLIWFRDAVNGALVSSGSKAKLTNDITLTSKWTPIGTESNPFKGRFEGQFHNITGMTINCNGSNQGLFGYINGAKLQNFVVSGTVTSNTAGLGSIGGAVGCGLNSTLNNVTSNVNISIGKGIGNSHVGGVVGHADGVKFDHCTNNGTIDAGASNDCIGGIAGYAAGASKFDYCNNTGDITSSNGNATIGGIMGYNNSSGFLGAHICLNSGKISGGTADTNAGAIYGRLKSDSSGAASGNYYLEGSATKGVGNDVGGKVAADAIAAKSKDEYFHYQNWTLVGVRYGSCTVTDNTVISFNGLNNSSWGDSSIQTGDYFGGNGNKGTVFWTGTVPNANSKFIAITAYTHSETIPSYTSLKRTSTYKVVMATDRFVHGASLYMFETLSSAFATALDAMPGQDEASMVGCPNRILKATDNNGNHSWTSATYTTTYDNSTSPGARTLSKYLDLMHVNNSGDLSMISQTGSQEWVGFQEESTYTDVWSYYAIITFDANGGSGTMSNLAIENSGTVASNAFTRTNYVFTGWNTQADGSGTSYAAGATFTATSTNKGPITLYAQWAPAATITFDANGGTGSMDTQVITGTQALTANTFTRTNYVFTGWNTQADGSGTAYAAAATITVTEENKGPITLYAQWEAQPIPVYKDDKTVDYYEIHNAAQLMSFAKMVNSGQTSINAKLMDNIDMSTVCHAASEGVAQVNWTPIGNDSKNYSGTFDGDNHTISNLYFNNTGTDYVGLFGYTSGATIQNVGMVNASLNGACYIGGVCGWTDNSTITNCYATGEVSGDDYVGGVCGINNNSTITNCYATGTVSGDWYVGGVCGYSGYNGSNSAITGCYATAEVKGKNYIGGVCGENNNSTITNCYTTATVSGTDYVGGVCGYNYDKSTITHCYATGEVSGSQYVGGVCGINNNSTISNCYTTDATAVNSKSSSKEYCVSGCVTLERFHSGEIAWLLNGSVDATGRWTAGTTTGTQAWYQTLPAAGSGKEGTTLPVLTKADDASNYVYQNPIYYCDGATLKSYSYSNDANATTTAAHEYNDNGFCKYCDALQPPTPVYKTDGNTVDYYEIGTAPQLWLFARMVNNGQTKINGKLTKDIDMSALCHAADESKGVAQVNWTPIGNSGKKYAGTFDGDNHTISNLYFNSSTTSYIGLFGYTYCATIQKVGVVNANIKGEKFVGGVCGCNETATITGCYATGTVSGTDDYVGGVCGYNDYSSTISNCYATGTVSGKDYVGGVCGENEFSSTITNCYATGTVSGNGDYVGGVCGINYKSTITNCYAIATNAVGISSNSTETRVSGGVDLKRFKSGEIAWLLNGSIVDGTWTAGKANGTQAWYQNLDTDDYPVLKAADGNTVYSMNSQYNNSGKIAVSLTQVGDKYYGVMYSDFPYSITDATAYIATGDADGIVTMSNANGRVAKETGVIIVGNAATATLTYNPEATSSKGVLKGSTSETTSADGRYVFGVKNGLIGLYKASKDIVAFKPYYEPEASSAKGMQLVFEDEVTTSINNEQLIINNDSEGAIYNLQGQKLNKPQKGVNIINGKKVMVR